MMKADALSYYYDYNNSHLDNCKVQLLKEKWFKARALVSMSRSEIEDQIRNANEGLESWTDGRLVIPKELTESLIKKYHNFSLTRHLG